VFNDRHLWLLSVLCLQSALGRRGGLWPVLLVVIHMESLCPSSRDINMLKMMMFICEWKITLHQRALKLGAVYNYYNCLRYSYPLVDELEYNVFICIYLPFCYRNPFRYAVTYFVLVIVFTYMANLVMVNDIIIQTHLLHLICQFSVLRDGFSNIVNDCQAEFNGMFYLNYLKL
jgi:hypothetical protein